jgi:hypothetical protein
MRNTFVCAFVLLLLSVMILSCKKEQLGNSIIPAKPNQYIDASVASGETFTFTAGSNGTLSVGKQALHFQVSETLNEKGSIFYKYKAAAGYIGADEVTLTYLSAATEPGINSSTSCPANHNTPVSAMSTIVIKLDVTK